MKKIFALLLLTYTFSALSFIDPKVGGTVTLAKGLEKNLTSNGVLFVLAKKAGPDTNPGDKTLPIAVVKIERPKFPQAFVITSNNLLKEGTSLSGPLHVIARYSISGNAMDRKGSIEGFDPKFPSTEIGNKNLKIELKTLINQ